MGHQFDHWFRIPIVLFNLALTWVPAPEAHSQLPVFDAIRKTILKAH